MKALEDLFFEELTELYDAEQRILKALPKMAKVACSKELKAAIETHEKQTNKHVQRLDRIFQALGKEPERNESGPIIKILQQSDELAALKQNEPAVLDAALIASAQKVEHYEISMYGTARSHAHMLGYGKIADLLHVTLKEEEQTDVLLTEIASKRVNVDAVKAPFAQARTQPRYTEVQQGWGTGALIFGVLIGAAAALLYAPKSGGKLRRELLDRSRDWRDSAESLAEQGVKSIREQRARFQDTLTGS